MSYLSTIDLRTHALLSAGISALLLVVWALTPDSVFWPQYAIVPLGLVLAVHAWFVLLDTRPGILRRLGGSRLLAAQLGVSAALWLYLVALWATAPGYFWPAWALLALGLAAGVHAVVVWQEPRPEPAPPRGGSSAG